MQQLTPKITWVEGLSRQGFRHEKLLNKQNKQTIHLLIRAEEETPFWSKARQASNRRLQLHNQLDIFKAASRKRGSGTWLRTALTGSNGLRLGGGRLAGGVVGEEWAVRHGMRLIQNSPNPEFDNYRHFHYFGPRFTIYGLFKVLWC